MRSNNLNEARFDAFHKLGCLLNRFLVLFLVLTLAACGGGGGGISRDATQDPGTDPGTTTNLNVSLSIANAESGEVSDQLSSATPLTVTAIVTDNNGTLIAGELVTFNFNDPNFATFDPVSGTALTDAQGVATIGLVVGANAGSGVITGQLQTGESDQVGFTSAGDLDDGSASVTISLRIFERNSGAENNQLSADVPLSVEATVLNSAGNPVADQLVTYTFNIADLAVFDPASGTALTNDAGISVMGLTVGTLEGDGLVTAQLPSGETAQIGFGSSGDLNDGVKSIELTITSKNTGEPDNELTLSNPLIIDAVVLGSDNNPVSDELITFTFSQDGLAAFIPESGTSLTDEQGTSDIEIIAGANAGSGLVTATLSTGETASVGFNSSGGAVIVTPPDFIIVMNITDLISGESSNQLSSQTPLSVTTTVTDVNGQPVTEQLVTYTFSNDTLATFDPINGETLTVDGISQVTLRVGEVAGDGLVFATLPTGEQAQIGFTSAGDLGNQGKELGLSIVSASTGDADNNLSSANPLTVQARVVTSAGAPVVDELITFTLSDNNLAFLDPASGTALTNTAGFATIELLVGLNAGAGKVLATLESNETAEIGFNSAGDGQIATEQPATLDFFTSSLVLASSGSDQVELIALVKNEDNILMEGVDVSFSADSGELSIVQGTTLADGTARALLTSQNNPENRTITVNAQAGSLVQSLIIDVAGTVININAPTSVILNDTGDVSIIVANSDGIGIPNQQVILTSQVEGSLSNSMPMTDETGQLTVTYNALQSGVDELSASALNAFSSQQIVIQEDEFSFGRTSEAEVNLNTDEAITITWLKDNQPFQGGTIVFTTTRGTLSSQTGTTDENGQVSVIASSTTSGNTIIGAKGTDDTGGEVSARIEFEYVATEVSSIIVSASPNSIGPGGQKSTITAVLRDPIGNLVKGKTVGFTAVDVSGGEIFPPAAVTDSNGIASTVYTSNTVTSEDAIVITATEEESAIAGSAEITVADRALFISIGTGNTIEAPTTDSYLKRFSLFVTDANSNPVSNVELTVSGTPVRFGDLLDPNAVAGDPNFQVSRPAYFKGFWEERPSADAFEFWAAVVTASCSNEDQDGDAILDIGEDTNGDGEITPGNIVSITGNVITDSNGQGEIVLRYPKSFGAWVTVNITASTPVAGSENRVSQYFTLGVSAEDATVETSPPNDNPFGSGNSCNNTL